MSDKKTKPAAKAAAKPAATKASKGSIPPKAPTAQKGAPKSIKGAPKAAAAPAPAEVKPTAAPNTTERKEHGFRRKIIGLVVGDKMNKTVTVEVIRKAMHPMYKKYVRERNRYKAHDEHNVYKVGDRVEIMEHRPISRNKRWLVTRLVSRPVEA